MMTPIQLKQSNATVDKQGTFTALVAQSLSG
jgi:hypothetical protein